MICDSSSVSPTDFILLIDVSGSMSGRKIEEAKKACIKLIQNTLDLSTHKLGIIAFGSHIKELCKPTQNRAELMYAVDRIVIEGSTNMSGAISRANDELAHSKNKKAIIV